MNISLQRVVMLKFISASVLLLLLQGCEGKSNLKSSDDNTPSAVVDDTRTPSQPVDNTPLIINGHILPPEPDPSINSATLLGVDVNHNDVRDDVERWIYMTYKDKHPIYIDIAMQAARGYKLVLEHPERAKIIHNDVRKARHCEFYYKYDATEFNNKILIGNDFDRGYLRDRIYFNTKERIDAYIMYDTLLSGDSYTLPSSQEEKAACDFNTSKYE